MFCFNLKKLTWDMFSVLTAEGNVAVIGPLLPLILHNIDRYAMAFKAASSRSK